MPKNKKAPSYQTWMTIVYDKNLKIVDIINPQHCMLLQLPEDILLGMDVSELEQQAAGPNKVPAGIIAKNVRAALREHRNVYFEYSTTHKDGSTTYAVCFAENGADGLLYANILKIDEENIFEARDGFTNYVINTTMNNISVGVYMRHIHEDGTKSYILFNDVAKEFYESDDVQQSKYWNQADEDQADEKTLELRDPLKIEKVLRDGEDNIVRWLVVTKKKITSHTKGLYIVTTIIDITKRRQNEILLEQQFALLDSMYKHLPVGILIYNKEGNLASFNGKIKKMFGLKDCALGKNMFNDPNMPDDIKVRLKAGEDIEYEVLYDFSTIPTEYFQERKNNKSILSIKAAVIKNKKTGATDGYLQICEDITEQKSIEKRLWRKHQLIETIYNTIPIGVELYDQDGRLIEINRHDMQTMGVENKETVLGANLFDDPNTPDDIKQKTRNGENVEYTLEYDFDLAHDEYYNTSVSGKKFMNVKTSILRDSKGNIDGYLLVNQDQTKTIERERLLEETATKFSTMFDSLSHGVEIYDKDGFMVDCNSSDLKIFGVENKEDLINSRISIYDNPNASYDLLNHLLKGEKISINILYDFEIVKQKKYYPTSKSGKIIIEVKLAPLFVSDGEFIGYVAEVNDVTQAKQDEETLKNARQDLELALNAGNVAAWTYDVEGEVFHTLHGNALAGLGISMVDNMKILHPDDHKIFLDTFNSIINGRQQTASAIFRYIQPDGQYRQFESKMIAKQNQGKVTTITGTQKDITEQIEYQQNLIRLKEEAISSNQLLNLIIDRVPGGMYIKDTSDDFKYLRANKIFCEIVGKPAEEVVGFTDFDLFDAESARRYRAYDLKLRGGENTVFYQEQLLMNGKQECWLINKSIVTTLGDTDIILGITTNITKFHEINQELQAAKAAAEQSDKLKSAFLANMSHEIRTPLNAIVGFSELLQTCDDPEEKADFVKIISTNNDLLLRLIGDILDLSKIESGMLELQPEKFDLSATFHDALTALQARCTNPDIELTGIIPCSKCIIVLDKNRLLQVVTNFVTNAIKYTAKGQIVMGYEYVQGGVRVYVKDTGIGIAREKQKQLFHRFAKLDSFAQGTGLGLAISKAITHAMDGKIGCESEEGKGSTFWAWFPCEAEIELEAQANCGCDETLKEPKVEQPITPIGKEYSILVAEDNESNYVLIEAILKECELTHAVNGAEAVELASQKHYTAILMDMSMPVMGGLEATRRIRQFDKKVPIIALTANVFDSDKADALMAGCNAFITKPLKKNELEAVLRMI